MNSFQNKLLALLAAIILIGCGDSKSPPVEAQIDRQKVAEVAAAAASAAYGNRLAEDKIDTDKRAASEATKAEEERLAKERQIHLELLVATGKVADLAVEARKGFDSLGGGANTSLYGTATLIIGGAAGVLPDGYRAVSNSFWLWAVANQSKLDELIRAVIPRVRRSADLMEQIANAQIYLSKPFDVKEARDMVASCKDLEAAKKYTDDSPCKEYDDKYAVGRDVLYVAEFLIRRHSEGEQALAETAIKSALTHPPHCASESPRSMAGFLIVYFLININIFA